ncbi:hypothetical protein QBC39DRAFT_382644 [Podospora conica]|nr:hypothetical protein QBC39DRAFT_382644 [Schizothecium conicum]
MLLARDTARRALDKKVVSAWLRQTRSLPPSATPRHPTSLDRPFHISTTSALRAPASPRAPPNPEDGEFQQASEKVPVPSHTDEHIHRPLQLRETLDVAAGCSAAMTGLDRLSAILERSINPHTNLDVPNTFGETVAPQPTPFSRILTNGNSNTTTTRDKATTPPRKRAGTKAGVRRSPPERTIGTVSPVGALRILKAMTDGGAVNESEMHHLRALLTMMPQRLPMLTAQALLRQRATQRTLSIHEEELLQLASGDMRSSRFCQTADERDPADIVSEWAWIISAESADLALERFHARKTEKPIFLVTMLLDENRVIRDPRLFNNLLHYIHLYYVEAMPEPSGVHDSHDLIRLQQLFLVRLLKRLAHHSLTSFPTLLPSVAKTVCNIIEAQAARTSGIPGPWHAARCSIFNKALSYFSHPPSFNTMENMVYNWEAQKELLKLSSRMHPPLLIGRHGYRAIRRVMVALKKTSAEREAVKRAGKTWPPYRRAWDGRDESLKPEDSLSRSARAGSLMTEAGYPDANLDRALDVLGGSKLGQTPTIQTRSQGARTPTGKYAGLSVFTEWCSRIEATRNAREAWEAFNKPPIPGLWANASVYAEMFEKLYAREASGYQSDLLPGDARRVFPVYDGNLSAFEIARITPPGPEDLYEMMLGSRIRPVGRCLNVLVQNAHSKVEAMRYLRDSTPEHSQLASALESLDSIVRQESVHWIGKMPLGLLRAWVAMLCWTHQWSQREHIEEAIEIAKAFHHRSTGNRFDKTTWHSILVALAGQKVTYGDRMASMNPYKTLRTFLAVWEATRVTTGFNPILFEQLCRVITKTLRLSVFKNTKEARRSHVEFTPLRLRYLLHRAYALLEHCFVVDLETSVCSPQDNKTTLVYKITARQVCRYMQALSAMGDVGGAVRLMDWLLDAWDRDDVLREAKDPDDVAYHEIIEAISCFDGIARQMVDAPTRLRLANRLETLRTERGCTWYWSPATEENEHHVNLNALLEKRYKFPSGKRVERYLHEKRGAERQDVFTGLGARGG